MKIILWSVGILILLVASWSLGRVYGAFADDKDVVEFTQCFFAVEERKPQIADSYYHDPERQCYGRRYRIPKEYIDYLAPKNGVPQQLQLKVSYPDLAPPKRELAQSQQILVVILSYQGGTFHERAERMIHSLTSTGGGLEQSNSSFDWLQRYVPIGYAASAPRSWLSDFHFSLDPTLELFFECALPFTQSGVLVADLGCHVHSHIDNQLRVKYDFRRGSLAELREFHPRLMTLLKSFSARTPMN